MLTFSDLLNGAKGPKEVMDAFNLAQEAMGLFMHLENMPFANSDMEQRRLNRIWRKAKTRLDRRKEALDAEIEAFNAFPLREDLEQTYPAIRGTYQGPLEMDYVLGCKRDFESKYHDDGSLVFGDLRIVRQDWGYNLIDIPY